MSERYYRTDPNLVKREVDDDGALLFHPDYNLVKVINLTGLFILDRLDGKTSPETISNELADMYDVSEQEAREDVDEFLEELSENRLIGKMIEI